jgi:sec-independent protein translocase protein TatC
MSSKRKYDYPEDFFVDTRMTFGDHLEELRLHLWRALAGFGVAMVFCFFIGKPVLKVVIIDPVENQLVDFYDRRAAELRKERHDQLWEKYEKDWQIFDMQIPKQFLQAVGKGQDINPIDDPQSLTDQDWVRTPMRLKTFSVSETLAPRLQELGPKPSMKAMSITEVFMVYIKVSLACGLVVASPWIFWQIWMFIAAGLYPHEKRYVHVYLPFSLGLFLTGALVCQFLVLPKAIEALLWFNGWIGVDPDLRLNEWLGFALAMPLVFGISFQTPLVMLFLYKIGILGIDTYQRHRKIAFFIMAVFAAMVTPSVDAVSMSFLWVPMCLLYQLGIWLCQWSPREEWDMDEAAEADELVEV